MIYIDFFKRVAILCVTLFTIMYVYQKGGAEAWLYNPCWNGSVIGWCMYYHISHTATYSRARQGCGAGARHEGRAIPTTLIVVVIVE
ncbi:hypothetical protein Bmyc01_61190 [Bacillus mycoides]|nr:hypothetical protein Bmyc01_61190 [Bacillus mycoides]